jgi:hypothetical protein
MTSKDLKKLPMINIISLFPKINKSLIHLLMGLKKSDWNKETALPKRSVKDLASHILDGSLRRLSMCRDNYQMTPLHIKTYKDLVKYIQKLNKTGIEFFKRLSPQLLIYLLKISEDMVYKYFKTLSLNKKAKFAVAWAGEEKSLNWFDIAREYTEKWHHQMQIRLALNKINLINTRKLFYPVIDTFMRGLPHTYRNIKAKNKTGIEINIKGNANGTWFLENLNNQWQLTAKLKEKPKTKIRIKDDIAWRLFTDSLVTKKELKQIKISGNKNLGKPFLKMKCVMR